MKIGEICALVPVIPLLVIEDLAAAVPLARALVAGGLRVLEVTLRTPAGLEAIRAMAEAVPGAVVGAGTLLTAGDVVAAKAAGAQFGVSPGWTKRLLDAAEGEGLAMLPGVATPSEAMAAAERGLEVLKFFPAEQNGGASALKAWAGPLRKLRFCPTGGVSKVNAPDYLSLPNVICVGGSWLAPGNLVATKDWRAIEFLAAEAARMAT
jgi:2-dehydro-3-deoxyphosphogluconate aldolase/(4S)-4-hydroxy-2-oxoglutarate aldolase